jgi:hypothetical protein
LSPRPRSGENGVFFPGEVHEVHGVALFCVTFAATRISGEQLVLPCSEARFRIPPAIAALLSAAASPLQKAGAT